MRKINKIRGFDPDKIDEKLDKNALSREIDNITAQRDADLIELKQRNLFEGRTFNPNEFNKYFEKNKKKQEKTRPWF
jgi:hypothetical protein